MLFCQQTQKRIYIITWSQLNHPLFAQESAVCTKQNLGREYNTLPSVTTHSYSSFSKSVMSQKLELFLVEPEVKSQWTVLVGYLTNSTK